MKRSNESDNEEGKSPCHVKECTHNEDCEIVRILGRGPKAGRKCSYMEADRTGKRKTNKEVSNDL